MKFVITLLLLAACSLRAEADVSDFVKKHCVACHDTEGPSGELDLASLTGDASNESDAWERVVRKLNARQMPPLDQERPTEAEYSAALKELISGLDRAAAQKPNPGRTETLRRLTRTEYQNAIRDLLHVDIDAAKLLPKDESSQGFDNITVGELSPTLLNRYVSAAQKISRLAMGGERKSPSGDSFRLPGDLTQEQRMEGLPFGTRGGLLIDYTFPRDGEYEIQMRLARDRNEEVEGLNRKHEVVFLIDRKQVKTFFVDRPKDKNHSLADAHLKARVTVKAGRRKVAVTFIKDSASLIETKRQPYDARFNMHRHRRTAPAVFQVSITGPFESTSPGDTAARQRIFEAVDQVVPTEVAAETILGRIVQRAYRRPAKAEDLAKPMAYFRQAWGESTPDDSAANSDAVRQRFEAGLQLALTSVLISPEFLFRIERDPNAMEPGTAYAVSDTELASRLSFFLWSSIPDDELLELAKGNRLRQPDVLKAQVQRMLADEKSDSLTSNFASQWLYLRNLNSITPDLRQFPDFDDNLRQGFRRETELFFDHVRRENLSVLELLSADYTFLNERLAKHYGIPHIYGTRFRRVQLDKQKSHRGGLLRHGSILTVTSYATRTSPVLRGHWILKNLVGSPPPPPPADVPALKDNTVDASLSVRERLAQHRANPACAACHDVMDPVGFALENFDAIGGWRETELGKKVDASGGLPGRGKFVGVAGLERGLVDHPDLFVTTLTEKLMTFALGRGVETSDAPYVRQIVRTAAADDYRFNSLVLAITQSLPFRMRIAEPVRDAAE